MSEKQAKAKRRESEKTAVQEPKIIGRIVIDIVEGMRVTHVNSFPDSAHLSINLLMQAQALVTSHFLQLAADGKLDENFNIQKSKIVTPENNGRIILPGGMKVGGQKFPI